MKNPEAYVQGVLDRVKPEHLHRHYFGQSSHGVELVSEVEWTSAEDFMTRVAFSCGRLLKGGKFFFFNLFKKIIIIKKKKIKVNQILILFQK